MAGTEDNYYIILGSLKDKIRLSRQKAAAAVNRELLEVYHEIGKTILQHKQEEGWGKKIISRLGGDLRSEFPDMKGLSQRNLEYMQTFASSWPYYPFTQPVVAEGRKQPAKGSKLIPQPSVAELQVAANQSDDPRFPMLSSIPWAHHILILDKVKTLQERLFYIVKTAENGWSKAVLGIQIEGQLYARQGRAITNFDVTLPKGQSDLARETLKSSYLFEFLGLGEEAHERELEKALVQQIKKFMLELGRGFAYVGNQYNLVVENDDYFLDMLFYNYHLRCFVIIELKVGDFKPEYTGKLNFYINTVNQKIKAKTDEPTIGLLLCKTPNATVVKYALQGINSPMGVAEYAFTKALPRQLKSEMPSVKELEEELKKETAGFMEPNNPVDERFKALKEKLKSLKTEEIQTPATYPILLELYNKGLRPLYKELIKRLSAFEEQFFSVSFGWNASNFNTNKFEQLDELWQNEESLKKQREIDFFYTFFGFRKGGTEGQNLHLTLKFQIVDYSYRFVLVNYNNQQPFLKRLYHQPIGKEEQNMVIDLMMNSVMDKIDWMIEQIG